jgi:hypothetical protein
MSLARRFALGLAALALPVCAVASTISPATADVLSGAAVAPASSGTDRLCFGVDDVDHRNTTWVCLPEAQWYGAVLAVVLAMNPA